ncbi:MAG: sialidase family protein [Bdellovibrionales bacterium]
MKHIKANILRGVLSVVCILATGRCSSDGSLTPADPSPTGVSPSPGFPERVQISDVSAYGIFDPSLAPDPVRNRVWMSYSAVDQSQLWDQPAVYTRLAYSDDEGVNWSDFGTVNPVVDVTLSMPAPNNQGTWYSEVSQIVYDPGALAGQRYKMIWHQWLTINKELRIEYSWLAMKTAATPEGLVNATPIKLFSGFAYNSEANTAGAPLYPPISGPPKIALDKTFPELANCIFTEPGMYANAKGVYVTVYCGRPFASDGPEDPDYSRVGLLKCASPCDMARVSSWKYIATLFTNADTLKLGYDGGGFGATGMFEGEDGTVYLTVTPSDNNPGPSYYKGCYIYKFTDLDSGILDKTAPARIFSGENFNGACAFHKAAKKAGLMYIQTKPKYPYEADMFQIFKSGITF